MIARSVSCVTALLTLGVLLGGCATTAPTTSPFSRDELRSIKSTIDSVLFAPSFFDTWWSAHVVDPESGSVIYTRNANKNLVPASNVKLYTTAAALEHLGPDYKFETVLYASGEILGDTLVGDLFVRGSGDPTISERYMDEPLSPLHAWADSLAKAGIRVVLGDVIGDDGLFLDPPLGSGWMWDDEDSYDSAQISALSIHDNCVRISTSPTVVGDNARVTWEPFATSYVTVVNESMTLAADSVGHNRVTRRRGTNDILVLSSVPMDTAYANRRITINEPAGYFAHLLTEVLRRRGIFVVGDPRAVASVLRKADYSDPAMRRLASHTSPPLSEVVRQVNKDSENLDSELLLRAIGVARADHGSARRSETRLGLQAVKETVARAGADTTRLTLVDGSGLSRYDLVSASGTAQLLTYMSEHPDQAIRDAFFTSLPVGGVDGTLKGRYPASSPARGRVFAKTGTMTAISSLSGYVSTDSGRQLVFSLMSNNYSVPTDSVRAAQDAIVSGLTRL